jgi:hypothetical protein
MESGAEGFIVIACIVGLAVLWLLANLPGQPDPNDPEQAPQVVRDSLGTLVGACLLAIIAIGAVLAL